jgi:hypothetical protein
MASISPDLMQRMLDLEARNKQLEKQLADLMEHIHKSSNAPVGRGLEGQAPPASAAPTVTNITASSLRPLDPRFKVGESTIAFYGRFSRHCGLFPNMNDKQRISLLLEAAPSDFSAIHTDVSAASFDSMWKDFESRYGSNEVSVIHLERALDVKQMPNEAFGQYLTRLEAAYKLYKKDSCWNDKFFIELVVMRSIHKTSLHQLLSKTDINSAATFIAAAEKLVPTGPATTRAPSTKAYAGTVHDSDWTEDPATTAEWNEPEGDAAVMAAEERQHHRPQHERGSSWNGGRPQGRGRGRYRRGGNGRGRQQQQPIHKPQQAPAQARQQPQQQQQQGNGQGMARQ